MKIARDRRPPLREITGEALFNEVFLDDVFVPDDCVVGEWRRLEADPHHAGETSGSPWPRPGGEEPPSARWSMAAELDLTEAQRARVGRAVALSTVCALLGVRTTLRSLAGHGPGAESSVAKLLGVRNRQDGAELVVELQGDGLVRPPSSPAGPVGAAQHPLLSIAGGTTQILRNEAGERILGLPR
jgi:alkylation response protein AidB-like acyl-CoA dehydrogenase